jgi:hypothetical protein
MDCRKDVTKMTALFGFRGKLILFENFFEKPKTYSATPPGQVGRGRGRAGLWCCHLSNTSQQSFSIPSWLVSGEIFCPPRFKKINVYIFSSVEFNR